MGERVKTVGGNRANRPVSEFQQNIAGTEYYVGPNASLVGDDDRTGKSKKASLATWAEAIDRADADKNDIIYLLPGHAETFATAAAVNINKAGIRTINLGVGALAATFTFSAVDATVTMTAASCTIEGKPIFKPSIDSVVSPIVVSAADCKLDVEVQDASATVECVNAILTTAAADRLDVNLKYRGFIAGNACVNAIRLVGVDTARIYVDFYGVASTSIVEFHTTACHDIDIKGKFYNDGTSLTKNVVDTATGSTWSAQGWDGNSNANFSGGDNSALASDDGSAIAAQTTKIDAATLAVAPTANSLAAFIASGGTALGQELPDSQSLIDLIGDYTGPHDGAVQDDNIKASLDLLHTHADATPQCVEKSDGAVLTGLDPLFTITGGPVRCKIVGHVTTIIGGATNLRLQHITTDPAATVDLNAGAVAADNDAVGTVYHNLGATSVFTPSGGLGFVLLDPVTVEETEFVLAPGVVQCLGSAAQTGVIKWYMTYEPCSPSSAVVAAA